MIYEIGHGIIKDCQLVVGIWKYVKLFLLEIKYVCRMFHDKLWVKQIKLRLKGSNW